MPPARASLSRDPRPRRATTRGHASAYARPGPGRAWRHSRHPGSCDWQVSMARSQLERGGDRTSQSGDKTVPIAASGATAPTRASRTLMREPDSRPRAGLSPASRTLLSARDVGLRAPALSAMRLRLFRRADKRCISHWVCRLRARSRVAAARQTRQFGQRSRDSIIVCRCCPIEVASHNKFENDFWFRKTAGGVGRRHVWAFCDRTSWMIFEDIGQNTQSGLYSSWGKGASRRICF